jgi:four helix bundle protein
LSAQLNIAEGHALRSQRRFHNHLVIAYGSAVETIDLLEHVLESNLVPSDIGYPVLATAVETRRLLLGLMKRYG